MIKTIVKLALFAIISITSLNLLACSAKWTSYQLDISGDRFARIMIENTVETTYFNSILDTILSLYPINHCIPLKETKKEAK